jgi:hypothetical protein
MWAMACLAVKNAALWESLKPKSESESVKMRVQMYA